MQAKRPGPKAKALLKAMTLTKSRSLTLLYSSALSFSTTCLREPIPQRIDYQQEVFLYPRKPIESTVSPGCQTPNIVQLILRRRNYE